MALAEVGVGNAVAVGVGPAVETALDHPVELAGREVVAEQVAPVVGGVQFRGARTPVEADRVAQAGGVGLHVGAVGAQAEQAGATLVLFLADVAARSDRNVEPAVGAEAQRARPVVAASGQPGQDALEPALRAAGAGIEADPTDGVHLRNVQPAGLQIHALRAVEPDEQRLSGVGASVAVRVGAHQRHLAGTRPADQQVARGRQAHEAGVGQAIGEEFDRKPVRGSQALPFGRARGRGAADQRAEDRCVDHIAVRKQQPAGGDDGREQSEYQERASHGASSTRRRSAARSILPIAPRAKASTNRISSGTL